MIISSILFIYSMIYSYDSCLFTPRPTCLKTYITHIPFSIQFQSFRITGQERDSTGIDKEGKTETFSSRQ